MLNIQNKSEGLKKQNRNKIQCMSVGIFSLHMECLKIKTKLLKINQCFHSLSTAVQQASMYGFLTADL